MAKRKVNEQLADVWAELINEKMSRLSDRLENEDDPMICQKLDGLLEGYADALTIFDMLEKGRFQKDWNRLTQEAGKAEVH